jgi:hypothetical protein
MPDPTFAMRTVGPIVLVRWGGAAHASQVEALARASAEAARAHPRAIGHVNLVETDMERTNELDDETRGAILRLLRDPALPLRCSSVVIPREGFQAALVRAIVGGLLLMSRTRTQVRVHASLRAGSEWVLEGLSMRDPTGLPTAEDLVDAMQTIDAGD